MIGIRGAVCAAANSKAAIRAATRALLSEIVRRNVLEVQRIQAAFFTMTPDLDADFPAHTAREMGWISVPMLGAQESPVEGAAERTIRVLLLVDGLESANHVYLGRAAEMRPDLTRTGDDEWVPGPAEAGRAAAPVPAPDLVPDHLGRLLVVGLGLVGGSLAAASRKSGLFKSVHGYDRKPAVAREAMQRGLVDAVGDDLDAELAAADVVALAAPVDRIIELIPRVGAAVRAGTLVTDVGSTKRKIVAAMTERPDGVCAVGGHPMAGSTAAGPGAARPGLFQGARWALVATRGSDDDAMEKLRMMVRSFGAEPVVMEAEAHDRIVALTSHVPALMAVGLVENAAQRNSGGPLFAGPGFWSATRLAESNVEMMEQILLDNSDCVGAELARLEGTLGELRAALAGDRQDLRARLSRAREARGALLGL